jgi:hypothetical protein
MADPDYVSLFVVIAAIVTRAAMAATGLWPSLGMLVAGSVLVVTVLVSLIALLRNKSSNRWRRR